MAASTTVPVMPGGAHLRVAGVARGTASHVAPDWSKRIPALDGLRGVAILLVLLAHHIFGFGLRPSSRFLSTVLAAGKLTWSGVDLFFVLSGFLIGGILLDAKDSPRYFKTFYIRRACRIFPLYFLITGSILAMRYFSPQLLHDHPPSTMPSMAYLTLTQNLWLWHTGIQAMVPSWSLCVEEQFYLTIPLAIRFFSRRQLVVLLGSIILLAPILRFQLAPLQHGDVLCYELTPCRADALSLGVLSAVLVRNRRFWRFLTTQRVLLRAAFLLLLAGVTYMTWQGYSIFRPPMNTVGLSWMALFYTVVLLVAVSSSNSLVRRILCSSQITWLGTLAYCTYLLHYMLRNVGWWAVENTFKTSANWSRLLGGLLGLAVTLVLASLSWRFFEKPFLRLGHKFRY